MASTATDELVRAYNYSRPLKPELLIRSRQFCDRLADLATHLAKPKTETAFYATARALCIIRNVTEGTTYPYEAALQEQARELYRHQKGRISDVSLTIETLCTNLHESLVSGHFAVPQHQNAQDQAAPNLARLWTAFASTAITQYEMAAQKPYTKKEELPWQFNSARKKAIKDVLKNASNEISNCRYSLSYELFKRASVLANMSYFPGIKDEESIHEIAEFFINHIEPNKEKIPALKDTYRGTLAPVTEEASA
jgi:hypothetical protein